MRHRAAAAVLAALTGCAPTPEPLPDYRVEGAPISSSVRFAAEAVRGDWHVLARFGAAPAPQDRIRFDTVVSSSGGQAIWVRASAEADRAVMPPQTTYRIVPPGRLVPEDGAPIWFLWLAEDLGTAIIGTPDGSFGLLINRGGEIRADRMNAALELFEFNGYDLRFLERGGV